MSKVVSIYTTIWKCRFHVFFRSVRRCVVNCLDERRNAMRWNELFKSVSVLILVLSNDLPWHNSCSPIRYKSLVINFLSIENRKRRWCTMLGDGDDDYFSQVAIRNIYFCRRLVPLFKRFFSSFNRSQPFLINIARGKLNLSCLLGGWCHSILTNKKLIPYCILLSNSKLSLKTRAKKNLFIYLRNILNMMDFVDWCGDWNAAHTLIAIQFVFRLHDSKAVLSEAYGVRVYVWNECGVSRTCALMSKRNRDKNHATEEQQKRFHSIKTSNQIKQIYLTNKSREKYNHK